jgi:hypothetical protein
VALSHLHQGQVVLVELATGERIERESPMESSRNQSVRLATQRRQILCQTRQQWGATEFDVELCADRPGTQFGAL